MTLANNNCVDDDVKMKQGRGVVVPKSTLRVINCHSLTAGNEIEIQG